MNKNQNGLIKFAAATVVYAGCAIYLYQPYFKGFDPDVSGWLRDLFIINVPLASLGCFVLSRRWVAAFAGSFFAGAIYGFGPFALGLTGYHPSVGLLIAAIPWLFCPAAFVPKIRWRWVSWPLSALPFVAIPLFFQISAHYCLFAIPMQTKLHLADLAGLLAPLVVVERSITLVGFYHIPIAPLIMGFSMLLLAQRFGIMTIFCLGTILAFCDSFLNISPVIWLTIPVLCCSVLIAVGTQGLISAGFADRKWILLAAIIMGVLAIVTLLLATKYQNIFAGLGSKYANLLLEAAKMYILGAIAVAIIFFMARAKLRVTLLRLVLLCLAMAVDIFLGARFIVDKIF